MIDDAGEIRARYDKLHLFDVDLPTGESWRESAAYARGRGRGGGGDAGRDGSGLSICYDLRFPDLYRALSDAGADDPRGPRRLHPADRRGALACAAARAGDRGGRAIVVAAAQTGVHADGRATYGHSLVIDPWGEVLLDMGEAPGLGFAEIDPARLADVRARIPALRHRRAIPPVETVA